MANFELKMPKLGESITEATITKWLKKVGDRIELDEAILEIATDKVDSEIPSPVEGILKSQLFEEGATIAVETVIALIDMGGSDSLPAGTSDEPAAAPVIKGKSDEGQKAVVEDTGPSEPVDDGRFYSPLVRSIAREENISARELEQIPGSGQNQRLTKADLMAYLKERKAGKGIPAPASQASGQGGPAERVAIKQPEVQAGVGDEVIEMDRMRRLIAEHMVMSEATSVHITLFTEADMTNLVNWRNKQKVLLEKREGQKLTFTPIFIEAIAKALRDYPMVNVSVDGNKIIKRKNINVGMAAALPNGNLIVPVIKNADHKSLLGIVKEVNDLADRARQNQLKPDEIQGGTFTLTNFGTFGATSGTPIINQPQVGILGVGLIQKKPVVIETPMGDTIGIRHRMILSLACDHRVVDGALGSLFMKRVAEYLENFDTNQNI